MARPISDPLVASGVWKDIRTGHQLIYLGGRLLDWQPATGAYRIWPYPAKTQPFAGPPLNAGTWSGCIGRTFVWLGGDDVMEWDAPSGRYTIWQYDRTATGDPLDQKLTSGKWPNPGRDLIYVGRGRLLEWDAADKHYQFWYYADRQFTASKKILIQSPSLPAPSLPPPSRLQPRLAWLGGDRLIAWDPQRGNNQLLRYVRQITVADPVPLPGTSPDLTGHEIVYLGQNHVLDWQPASGSYQIVKLGMSTDINVAIEDYLELHPNVRDAIAWHSGDKTLLYKNWDLYPTTAGFYQILDSAYRRIVTSRSVVFSFASETDPDTGAPRIAPQLYGSYMSARDTSEIFIAHVAQSLWVEIARKVGWRLHNYEAAHLALLLDAQSMFTEGTAAQNTAGYYTVNAGVSGTGTPTDPTKSYHFLAGSDPAIRSGPSFIKSSARETLFEMLRWVRDHLWHGPNIDSGPQAVQAYGYAGSAPIEKMFTAVVNPQNTALGPRYYAWLGCHSAAALIVWLMRAVNVPGRAWYTHFEDTTTATHKGVEIPTEQLFSAHNDDFYARPELLDPTIEPWEVFESEADYAAQKQKYTTPAAPGELRTDQHTREVAIRGLAHPTYYFVEAYWGGLAYGTTVFADTLINNSFSQADVPTITQQYASALQAAIDAFKQEAGLVGAQETVALQAYIGAHTAWKSAR